MSVMRGVLKVATLLAIGSLAMPTMGNATAIVLPTPVVVASMTPILFVYSGTITGADTLSLTATGQVQAGYGHLSSQNAAGVIVTQSVDIPPGYPFINYVTGTDANGNNYEALLLSISGVGVEQLFKPTAANGLGSSKPSDSLTLNSTSLSALGFGSFSVTNPTLTFMVDIDPTIPNYGKFTITQSAAPTATPEPGSVWLLIGALAGFPIMFASKKDRRRTTSVTSCWIACAKAWPMVCSRE